MNQRVRTVEVPALKTTLDLATRRGQELAEVLDRAGVILTASRLDQIKADTLDDLAEMLEGSDLSEWRGDMAIRSPLDAKYAITARIRLLAKATRTCGGRCE